MTNFVIFCNLRLKFSWGLSCLAAEISLLIMSLKHVFQTKHCNLANKNDFKGIITCSKGDICSSDSEQKLDQVVLVDLLGL